MKTRWKTLPREFYRRDPRLVGPQLLNKLLVRDDGRVGRIVEVEAYVGAEDPAAHSYRGKTARNATLFGPCGCLYVYFTYGMHWCANAVCGESGEGFGVLLRAIEPVAGVELMRRARGRAMVDRAIGSGPARLAQAMGLDRTFDGADLVTNDRGIRIVTDGMAEPALPTASARIGIRQAADRQWRWHVPGHPHVSHQRPGTRQSGRRRQR